MYLMKILICGNLLRKTQKKMVYINFISLSTNSLYTYCFSVSTKVENLQNMWISGSSSTFKLNANLRYPQQIIHYRPNFWQVIKFAWIQYLSLLITIHWIINKIKNYVFTNKLVLYHIESSAADFYTKEK